VKLTCVFKLCHFILGEFLVILSDDNTIGIEEIAASLLASKNVDPKLVDVEWIRNHYRWIVWKLASMEMRIPTVFARQCLTLPNVLEQLKYRYDLEIDRCQRSALKRIIEQVHIFIVFFLHLKNFFSLFIYNADFRMTRRLKL